MTRTTIAAAAALSIGSGAALGQGTVFAWDTSAPADNALVSLDAGTPGYALVSPGAVAGVNELVEIEYAEGVIYGADSGASNDQLRTIDPATGELLGSVTMTFPLHFLDIVTAMEYVDGVMYVAMTVENSNFDSYLGTVDLDTGVIAMIGQMNTGADITGLAWDGEYLYGSTGPGAFPKLYRWTLDGTSEWVADFTLDGDYLFEGMSTMEFSPEGHLYAIPGPASVVEGHLLIVNRGTAVCLDLGDTGNDGLSALTTRESGGDAPSPGCSAVDLAEPYGSLDFSDVISFLTLFGAGCP